MKKPLLTAWYDDDSGELHRVRIETGFRVESQLMQADVLLDLRGVVDALYRRALQRTFGKTAKARRGARRRRAGA